MNEKVRELCRVEAPLGVPQRHNHAGCSDGKSASLIITRGDTGWVWFCHRCQQSGFYSYANLPPSQTAGLLKTRGQPAKTGAARSVRLPRHYSPDPLTFPVGAKAWLYRYGITDEDIKQNQIGWDASLRRLIFPIYDDSGELIYWQGRNVGQITADNPKYLNQYLSGRSDLYYKVITPTLDIVLVEDIISAIRVGKICSTLGLLYATIPDGLILDLSKAYKRILLWLDADKAGYTLAKTKRFRSLGCNVHRIYTPKDPKYYTETEIKTIIEGV